MWEDNSYISTQDLSFRGVLLDVKKSRVALQPVYEAFTNAMESIRIRERIVKDLIGKIDIHIRVRNTIDGSCEFDSIAIMDNGIGFNNEEFKRFNTYKDYSKGFKNLGSGRIQYVQHFERTRVTSIYEEDGSRYERSFVMSRNDEFLNNNALVKHLYTQSTSKLEIGTIVEFIGLLEKSNIYNQLTAEKLKVNIRERYLHYLCYNRDSLPLISIKYYVQGSLTEDIMLSPSDIPSIDKSDSFEVHRSEISSDGQSLVKANETEIFKLDSFRVPAGELSSNRLKLVSKGELVENTEIELSLLRADDKIGGMRFIFLISGDYIDKSDTNERGSLLIPSRDSFSRNTSLFSPSEVILEDIQEGVDAKILMLYPEIQGAIETHAHELEGLKNMFLLDDESIRNSKITLSDSEAKILEKVYEYEARKEANLDSEIKKAVDNLNRLDPSDKTYLEELDKEIAALSKLIPLQNKNSLTQYVARRQLVLGLFEKVIDNKIDALATPDTLSNDRKEAMVHNLLFLQGAENPLDSDLWLINEDFIYFRGFSERRLNLLTLPDGRKLLKEKGTDEEERYLSSLGENRRIKRPDVLLFPEEGKCIIIEFKSTDVNVAKHLTQIDFYASLIRNHTVDDVQITTFYGYLLGEQIEPRDVLGMVSRFEHSYHFDYFFRPSEKVHGFDERSDGSIYTEVMKYSTLLKRATKRNEIFIDKIKAQVKG